MNGVEKCYSFDDNGRCLVSPAFGCDSYCSYCYCESRQEKIVFDYDFVIESIVSDCRYVEGETIISLGCFTECLFEDVLSSSIEIINYFLSRGHRVSIATKQDPTLLKGVCVSSGRFYVFISCPTVSSWGKLERNTLKPELRIDSIPFLYSLGAIPVLYIKPFLSVTRNDFDFFINVIEMYDVDVVVGRLISDQGDGRSVKLIGATLKECLSSDFDVFVSKLSASRTVYNNSIEVLTK